jgi:hypothetical protein
LENVAFYDEIHIEKRVAEENFGLLGSIRSNFDIADRACQPRRPYNSTTTQLLSRPITGGHQFWREFPNADLTLRFGPR